MADTFNPSKVIIMANAHDTLKNDDDTTVTVTIPGSTVIAAAGQSLASSDVTIGSDQSMADFRVQTSRDTTRDYLATIQLTFNRSGSLGSYPIYVTAYHLSAGIIRVQAFAVNNYGSSMTGQAGNETFTFKIRTFKAPF